ncbi:MAG: hypothetical protein MZV64_30130 [Ignavibacteriales bacterium]|nr:hypothetical protein [Ignavibacteriales bacterium]
MCGALQFAACHGVLAAFELEFRAPHDREGQRLRSPTISACRSACVAAASASFHAAICRNEPEVVVGLGGPAPVAESLIAEERLAVQRERRFGLAAQVGYGRRGCWRRGRPAAYRRACGPAGVPRRSSARPAPAGRARGDSAPRRLAARMRPSLSARRVNCASASVPSRSADSRSPMRIAAVAASSCASGRRAPGASATRRCCFSASLKRLGRAAPEESGAARRPWARWARSSAAQYAIA